MSSSHHHIESAITYAKELRELRAAINGMRSMETKEETDNMRVLFLCREKKAIHAVVEAACKLWSAHLQEPMPDLFFVQAKESVNGDINHVVHAILILILAYPIIQNEFKQAPMAPYFFKLARCTHDKYAMGLTESATFCSSAADRVCHGNIEFVMLMRQRYLSL
jgi:hypothetical protein